MNRSPALAYRGKHLKRVQAPLCSQCRMDFGCIKTPAGVFCADCWVKRQDKRAVEGGKAKR